MRVHSLINETREKINQTIEQTLLFALIFSVPASVGIYALSEQIISVLFERGEFDNESTLNTSEALKFYSIGLIAFIDMISMSDQQPLFKAPYDIKDVSALFAIVAFVLIIAAIVGNNLFGLFQENVNFG